MYEWWRWTLGSRTSIGIPYRFQVINHAKYIINNVDCEHCRTAVPKTAGSDAIVHTNQSQVKHGTPAKDILFEKQK